VTATARRRRGSHGPAAAVVSLSELDLRIIGLVSDQRVVTSTRSSTASNCVSAHPAVRSPTRPSPSPIPAATPSGGHAESRRAAISAAHTTSTAGTSAMCPGCSTAAPTGPPTWTCDPPADLISLSICDDGVVVHGVPYGCLSRHRSPGNRPR
jgi:hypothetical protein